MPCKRAIARLVTGFSKMPSSVATTTAREPSSIWNSLRIHSGITTWPLVVNHTLSDLVSAFMQDGLLGYSPIATHILTFINILTFAHKSVLAPRHSRGFLLASSAPVVLNRPRMSKLYFYYSAMNAGKSTVLLQASYNYHERGMRTLLFIPAIDTRAGTGRVKRSEEHTSELQSPDHLVCRLLLEKKKK